MKRLLIPLLAALALPTAVNADLGGADFPDVPTVFPIKKGKSKTIEIQNEKLTQSKSNEFQLYCGWITQRDFKKCKIQFKDGRLTVDDSLGIKPSQIKDINIDQWDGLTISYLNQNNNWKLAKIYGGEGGYRQQVLLHPFATRLFKWVNTGK
tara:strand:+ start:690 stop:1145 length:456 start_codon:yes stop_codon:yes gene_type:complete